MQLTLKEVIVQFQRITFYMHTYYDVDQLLCA